MFGRPGGFGQQPAAGGFGQPAAAAGGFGQRPAAGGFGQPAAGGFGQPAAGGFGQPAAGGFGQQPAAGGFGQQQPAAGGFGQPAAGGFGQQPAAGGFGQQQPAAGGFGQPAAGGFGQPQAAAGGFGQPAAGGFGQPAAGGFGQPAAGGFGQQQPAAGGFGQPAAGGFGQPAAGGFGQQPAAGGFGRPAAGGFGQPAAGGFGQPAAGGFGQQPAAAGGFGQRPAAGGFGQPAAGGFGQPAAAGGFGQQPAAGGFGQPAAAGGFGQKPGGFGQPAAGAAPGFGQQPAAGGFGQPAAGGFGQQPAAGGFGQPPAAGGFGQKPGGFGQPAAGGFGQPPAAGGFGQPAAGAAPGGFGQPAAGGFGQPAAGAAPGGFGQPAAGGFGQPAAGGFGQPPAAGGFGAAAPPGGLSIETQRHAAVQAQQFATLPDFNETPYGNVLMFLPTTTVREELTKPKKGPSTGTHESGRFSGFMRQRPLQLSHSGITPNAQSTLQHQAATISLETGAGSATSPRPAPHLVETPRISLGVPASATSNTLLLNSEATPRRLTLLNTTQRTPPPPTDLSAHAPTCRRTDFILQPLLTQLQNLRIAELQRVPHFTVTRKDRKVTITFLVPVNLVRAEIADIIDLKEDGRVEILQDAFRVRARVSVSGLVNLTREKLRERCDADGTLFEDFNEECGTWEYILYPTAEDRERQTLALEAEGEDPSPEESFGASPVGGAPAALDNSAWSQVPPMQEDLNGEQQPLMRSSDTAEGSLLFPYRGREAFVAPRSTQGPAALKIDFQLPYAFPPPPVAVGIPAPLCVVQEHFANQAPQVLYLSKSRSTVKKCVPDAQSPLFHARSFRASWSPSGQICVPTFAAVRDAGTGGATVPEVRGATVRITTPVTPVATHSTAVLQLLSSHIEKRPTKSSDEGILDEPVRVNLSRLPEDGSTLSDEKLTSLRDQLSKLTTSKAPLARLAQQQATTLITLLASLYGLPEGDKADGNADEERKFLVQLRRKRIMEWLNNELQRIYSSMELSETEGNAVRSPPAIDTALAAILRQRVDKAQQIAVEDKEVVLARLISLCGGGRVHNPYVAMSPTARKRDELSERMISVLVGELEPFLRQRLYNKATNSIEPQQTSATWRQLLNIYLNYGCQPSVPLEQSVGMFLERLETRGENPFPPYGERLSSGYLNSQRGRDVHHVSNKFADSTLLLLQAFSTQKSPSPLILHPCASSYYSSDYFCPFLLLLVLRSINRPRSRSYLTAEHATLLGFAEQLQHSDSTWFWGVFPLSFIEDPVSRRIALESFARRNAFRPFNTEARKVFGFCNVDLKWLTKFTVETSEKEQVKPNAPSMTSLALMLQAFEEFAMQ